MGFRCVNQSLLLDGFLGGNWARKSLKFRVIGSNEKIVLMDFGSKKLMLLKNFVE